MTAHDLLLLLAGGQGALLTLWALTAADTRRHRRRTEADTTTVMTNTPETPAP